MLLPATGLQWTTLNLCWASLLFLLTEHALTHHFSCFRLQKPGLGSLSMLCTETQAIYEDISISLVKNNRSHVSCLVTHRCLRRQRARMWCGIA